MNSESACRIITNPFLRCDLRLDVGISIKPKEKAARRFFDDSSVDPL